MNMNKDNWLNRWRLIGAALTATIALAACSSTPAASPTAAKPTAAPAAKSDAPAAAVSPAGSPAAGALGSAPVSNITIAGPLAGEAGGLTGAGATFPAPLYTKWFNDYEKLTNVKVNYQAIGSGGGIKAI